MHKFKFGQACKYKGRQVVYLKRSRKGYSFVVTRRAYIHSVPDTAITPDYAGTFTLRKARGGFRYNVVGLNNENITTSQVLKAKQSATEMHERHYRNYKLVDKTVGK